MAAHLGEHVSRSLLKNVDNSIQKSTQSSVNRGRICLEKLANRFISFFFKRSKNKKNVVLINATMAFRVPNKSVLQQNVDFNM